jgi:hypothetical protein
MFNPEDVDRLLLRKLLSAYCQNLNTTTAEKLTALRTIVYFVRFEVFTAMTMKNAVLWDIKT